MNIVYLHAHDAGRHLQPYGHPVPTPHLQRLAGQSTLFRNAFTAAPTCSPSRVALLTGVTAHEAGTLGLTHRGFHMARPELHLARHLRDQGFETVLAGVQHEYPWNTDDKGYVRELSIKGQGSLAEKDQAVAEAAAEYLREPKAKSFFLACGFILPHRGFPEPAPDLDPRFIRPPDCLPDTPETRADYAAYMEAARSMDRCCGVVLDALEETRLADDTLVVFTVDHGIAFPSMKCNLYDTGIEVALILRYPGNPGAGTVCDALVSQLDVYPTICDIAGVPEPGHLRGRSLRPLLEGKAASVRDDLFAEVTYHAGYEPMRCVRTERYKMIRYFDEDTRPMRVNVDASPSKKVMEGAGFFDRPRSRWQLFDLLLDPAERNNLADDPAHHAVRQDMESRLERWMRETDDPLLKGPVAAPKGAKVNLRSQLEPSEPVQLIE